MMKTPAHSTLWPTLKRLGATLCALSLCVTLNNAIAQTSEPSIQIVDAHGTPLEVVNHQGHRFVVATLGHPYMIRVSNPTSQEIEAVISVDARDVLTGQKSDPQARGYLIRPHTHYDVKGFRVSDTEVDTFTFSAKEDSYAAKWKDDKNIGIIGAIFYKKRPRGYAMAEETQELGTADGYRQVSKVVYRSFHRGERFEQPSIFYYDSRESLERTGVISRRRYNIAPPEQGKMNRRLPSAFPSP